MGRLMNCPKMNPSNFVKENTCRACLQPHGNKSLGEMLNICETQNELVYEILESICSIKVAINDGFPQKICNPCEDSLVKALIFKLRCKKSDEFLKSMNSEYAYFQESKSNLESVSCPNFIRCNTDSVNNGNEYTKEKAYSECIPDNLLDKQLQYYNLHDSANNINSEIIEPGLPNDNSIHQTNEILRCYVCDCEFEDKNEVSKHLQLHALECSKCNIKCPSEDLKEPIKKQFSKPKSDLEDFESPKHVPENRRTCEECGKVFQYRASMLKHLKKHNSLPKTCNYCDFIPAHPSRLGQHMEENHSDLKNISCDTCGKTFFKASNLRLHMAVHSGTKRHVCEVCGISFALACNLTAHLRLHTGERPYTCTYCGRKFTQQSALRSHEACHSDKRDHICADCGAAFSRAGALNNHRKRHLSTKSYVCTLCGKAFTFSSERKRHMTIHSGDRNYVCDVCGRRFNRSTNLKVHRRIHTGETPYVCNVCGKGFIQSHCLKTHMSIHNS